MAFSAEYIYRIMDRYSGPLNKISRSTAKFQAHAAQAARSVNKLNTRMRTTSQNARDFGGNMTSSVTLPLAGIGIAAAKTAIDFQSAFIGVQKTVNATPAQLERIREGFKRMSTEIPVSVEALNEIGESAGQLGIQTDNILGFSKVIAMLGKTTNLVGEEGAKQMARFANITQMSQQHFDRLGSTIVHLGNNMATTEAEIMEMGMRLAGSGKIVGMTEAQIMAMAATLTSLGINAEAGGTAFSRVMLKINDAVASGGPMLAGFAKTAGMSSKQFAETFKRDASKGVLAFTEGLARMQKEGKNVNAVLGALEMQDIRVRDALLRAAGSGDIFRKALTMSAAAWKENNALVKEANLRFGSWASQLTIAWNRLKLIANEMGKIIVPMFISFVDRVLPVLTVFNRLSTGAKRFIIIAGGIVAALGPATVAFGVMTMAVTAVLPVLSVLTAAVGAISAPIAVAAAGITAFVIMVTGMMKNSAMLRQSLMNLADAFKPLTSGIVETAKILGQMLGMSLGQSSGQFKTWGDNVSVVVDFVAGLFKGLFTIVEKVAGALGVLSTGNLRGALDVLGAGGAIEKAKSIWGKTKGLLSGSDSVPNNLIAPRETVAARGSNENNQVEISGQIGVSAAGGTKIERADINLNRGSNLAVAQ